jgi:hypothetical protein
MTDFWDMVPSILVKVDRRCNDTDRQKQKNSEKKTVSVLLMIRHPYDGGLLLRDAISQKNVRKNMKSY